EDLYYAQGYLTASQRLWQMDFISYAAAGRFSEIIGDPFLAYDRLQRRMGILDAAKKSLELINQHPASKQALESYTNGVNAFIQSLHFKALPFEYKLLDYEPERWTPLKSVLVIKYMANLLAGYEEDISMSKMRMALGKEDFMKLFPDRHSYTTQASPSPEDTLANTPFGDYLNYSFLIRNARTLSYNYNPRLGSNSWAVSGARTQSGNPMLCSDPHLNLLLPSTWFELQLVSKKCNAYGVSIPGVPGVVIGFNKDLAWGITNGATDVKDWYKLELSKDYQSYKFEGAWHKTKQTTEEIKIRGNATFVDTIYHTQHGPIVIDSAFNQTPEVKDHAMRWTLNDPSNEIRTFLELAKANNYQTFRQAIQHFQCPIQNFTYADRFGEIAVHHQGAVYEKWAGQGKFVLDGTRKDHLYEKKLTNEQLPQTHNPASGLVFSANNHPPLLSSSSHYLNGAYSEIRSNRLQAVFADKEKFSLSDMQQLQLDNTNQFATDALPILLQRLATAKPTLAQLDGYQQLQEWDKTYTTQSKQAVLFERWMSAFEEMVWDEITSYDFYLKLPERYVLLQLLQSEPQNAFFDLQSTEAIETADDLLVRSFEEVTINFEENTWGEVNQVQFTHLSFLEGLSSPTYPSSGHPDALNALSTDWGPSWRMVVELGERPLAYGICAGGNSGILNSPEQTQSIKDWLAGTYYELHYYLNKEEPNQQ
ncbi:MAG: penicillin acylase family protein, partial [Bacteroidota bacterium]